MRIQEVLCQSRFVKSGFLDYFMLELSCCFLQQLTKMNYCNNYHHTHVFVRVLSQYCPIGST